MGQSFADTFVVYDLETLDSVHPKPDPRDSGAVQVCTRFHHGTFYPVCHPKVPIPFEIETADSINDDMVLDAPTIDEILPSYGILPGCGMVAHNADFVWVLSAQLQCAWIRV